jgi:cathepsin A (carboxypeptidase C)
MRVLPTTLLIGATAAAVNPVQQVLQAPDEVVESTHGAAPKLAETLSQPLRELKDELKSLTAEAEQVWEEVSNLFPGSLDNIPFFSAAKKHTRRPDSHWDHIVRGSDVQSVWVENANGEKEREVGGRLETYDLRVKSVDPSSLGIDPDVKQYSGYLDDNENDKHLFYCMCPIPSLCTDAHRLTNYRVF